MIWRAIVLTLVVGLIQLGQSATLDRTIAKINDDILTESDLAEVLADVEGRFKVTDRKPFEKATSESVKLMLDRALLVQEAKRKKIVPSSDEMNRQVESMVKEIRSNFASDSEFHQVLSQENISLDQLQSELLKKCRTDYMVFQVVGSRYSVSETEIQKFEAEKSATGHVVSYRLRRIGIPIDKTNNRESACEKVHGIVGRIVADGMSFDEGVRRFSQVPGAAQDGGDLGYMPSTKLSADVLNAVQGLETGQASRPVIAGGYANIFYVEGKRGAKSALREQKFDEAKITLLSELRRKSILQVFDPRLMNLLPEVYRGSLKAQPVAGSASKAVQSSVEPALRNETREIPVRHTPSAIHNEQRLPQPEPTPTPAATGLRRWFGRR